jgi:phenylpyruvate tautomerase PptA (4-oxalocrotonate tautomerase family)
VPIIEITCLELPQESKDRIAKAFTEAIAKEEKTVYKVDTTSITIVVFFETPIADMYLGTQRAAKVVEKLPKA